MTASEAWRRRVFVGGLLLMVPVIGWPLILGYRRRVVERLVSGDPELLPPWRGHLLETLRSGLGAMAVIHTWYAPIYLWLALRMIESGDANGAWLWPTAALFIAVPIFSTMIIPVGVVWLRFLADAPPSDGELAAMSVAFAVVTFVIPAGFLQVSRTGSLWSAFRLDRDLALIGRHFARYVEAWIGSGVMSLVGHLCLPLAPFGVVWCYLGIVYSFNEVPADDARSWFPYFRREHWKAYKVARGRIVERYSRRDVDAGPLGPGDHSITCVRIGPLRAPLPRCLGRSPDT